jgi:hypothetical protein
MDEDKLSATSQDSFERNQVKAGVGHSGGGVPVNVEERISHTRSQIGSSKQINGDIDANQFSKMAIAAAVGFGAGWLVDAENYPKSV